MARIYFSCLLWSLTYVLSGSSCCYRLMPKLLKTCPLWRATDDNTSEEWFQLFEFKSLPMYAKGAISHHPIDRWCYSSPLSRNSIICAKCHADYKQLAGRVSRIPCTSSLWSPSLKGQFLIHKSVDLIRESPWIHFPITTISNERGNLSEARKILPGAHKQARERPRPPNVRTEMDGCIKSLLCYVIRNII